MARTRLPAGRSTDACALCEHDLDEHDADGCAQCELHGTECDLYEDED